MTDVKTGTFHQGSIEALLIQAARERGNPRIERDVVPLNLKMDESKSDEQDAYPISMDLKYITKDQLGHWSVNAHSMQSEGSVKLERGHNDAFGTDS